MLLHQGRNLYLLIHQAICSKVATGPRKRLLSLIHPTISFKDTRISEIECLSNHRVSGTFLGKIWKNVMRQAGCVMIHQSLRADHRGECLRANPLVSVHKSAFRFNVSLIKYNANCIISSFIKTTSALLF